LSNARILRIDLSPSRGLAAAIVTVHGGAAACAGVLVAGAAGVCLGLLIGCLGLAAAWDRALLRSPRSVRALRIEGKDYVTLELADAELVPVPIAPSAGDALTVYPGCDKQQSTCSAKFNNLQHFEGFPYIPTPETAV